MAKAAMQRTVHYIIKVSKFCNLRCKYCYELPELGNKRAMSLEELNQTYAHIFDYYTDQEIPTKIVFVWHGGEPLLQKPEFYWSTFEHQRRIFGGSERVSVENVVQTNLTVLDDERMKLLQKGFNGVGVSIDLFGGLRVNLAGNDAEARVLANIDRLRDAGIPFGGITVLTRLNARHVKKIFQFYEAMNMSFRLLPLFPGAFENQHTGYSITAKEVLEALCTVVDLWLESPTEINIIPISGHIQEVLHRLSPNAVPHYYSRRDWETAIMVNTNGDAFGYPEAYDPAYCYGNIFTTPIRQLFASENRDKSVKASELRMAGSCASCPYFGSCNGYYMAEDNHQYEGSSINGLSVCSVEWRLLQHIERRLKESHILTDAGTVDPAFLESGLKSRKLETLETQNQSLTVPS